MLLLERKTQKNETPRFSGEGGIEIEMTPPIEEGYWRYRVKLTDRQAIVGFPKFGTIGIGFAVEEDWNTNLPFTKDAEEIYRHIEHNKGDEAIAAETCIEAIRLIQDAARADRGEVSA